MRQDNGLMMDGTEKQVLGNVEEMVGAKEKVKQKKLGCMCEWGRAGNYFYWWYILKINFNCLAKKTAFKIKLEIFFLHVSESQKPTMLSELNL